MIQTSENNVEKPEEPSMLMSGSFTTEEYKPPDFNAEKAVIIPTLYLSNNHKLEPKVIVKRQFAEEYRGHHLWKGEWAAAETGGLLYIDKEKEKQQRGVLTFIIRRIGKNLLSGKGILNLSLPVDIFCRESNIERLAMSFGFFPVFMEKVIDSDPIEQLKAIICSVMGSSLIYLTMDKPFNPILG